VPDDTPIACSLTTAEMPARLAQIAELGRESLLDAGDSELRFRADQPTRERLAAFIAAESACCPFLDFELVEQADTLLLNITGPEPAAPLAAELVDAFRAGGAVR
jgi:hypothetical protein